MFDTNIVIDVLRKRAYARDLLEKWTARGFVAISTLTQLEIYQGIRPGEEAATGIFLDGLISIPVDVPIARQAGVLIQEQRVQRMTSHITDAIIAATALQKSVPLVTNNVRHFSFPNLNVVEGLPE